MIASGQQKGRIYTIPAGMSFVDILAKGIMARANNNPEDLARMQILLPTRRACRSLREAFLRLSNGKPLLLPRMGGIGDVDEEELSLSLSAAGEALSIPPAIAPLRRLFLLAKLVGARQDYARGPEQDLMLATALGKLMDQIYTEDLDLARLPDLVDRAEFSAHWQVSIKFLEILSLTWPKILREEGVIDAADRRNRLLKHLAARWRTEPPAHPVIAAGSTGSIPATAALLKTIAALPDGGIVLPGLDQVMDDDSWNAMDDTHPQATLRHLLGELQTGRNDVLVWPEAAGSDNQRRMRLRALTSEIMRPAATAEQWQTIGQRLSLTPDDLAMRRYDCANPQEEAAVIALALRGALEKDGTPEEDGRTAALVTPDRKLARRVAMACRRWGIEIDDSAGQPLSETRTGTYLRLCMETLCREMRPVPLLDFAKHALCLPQNVDDWRGEIRALDLSVLRGPAFETGFGAYVKKLDALEQDGRNTERFRRTLAFIEQGFAPLTALFDRQSPVPFAQWCDAHVQTAEYFCEAGILWSEQDGNEAASFFSSLREQADILPDVTAADYLAVIEGAASSISVRPSFGLHPRLMILGQLEARLVEADVMILSGLNENTWPPDPGTDPWMSRPMRKKFGLPPLERSIGLSAHDFAQSLCADHVVLTRSVRVDGTPTVPSRWLQRMDTVLGAMGIEDGLVTSGPLLSHARKLDHTDKYAPYQRPEPRPPVAVRPRKLSVTQIETWMSDPYSIYARHILKLRALEPLEKELDAAMRGTLVHETLDRFVARYPDAMQDSARADLLSIAREQLDALGLDAAATGFWEPRLGKIADWIVETEKDWRAHWKPSLREAGGELSIDAPAGPFTLRARVDRIDLAPDRREAAIIDYKTGGSFSRAGMKDGKHPQLPLESLILEQGGFADMKTVPVGALSYWIVNGSGDGGKLVTMDKAADIEDAKDKARDGLERLVAAFDSPDTPYYSLPAPARAPKYNDYEHLARIREWTALDDSEDAA